MKCVLTQIPLLPLYRKIFTAGNYGMLFPRSGSAIKLFPILNKKVTDLSYC
jgi:hypothetical protein